MEQATVYDLRYRFSELEALLNKGEEVEIRKRRKVTARLLPHRPKADAFPHFAARRKRIFGNRKSRQTGTELVAEFRGLY
jgi:antitoxin (DNA-binding transcriptional repressor) of toxin-antitoxin stability system